MRTEKGCKKWKKNEEAKYQSDKDVAEGNVKKYLE